MSDVAGAKEERLSLFGALKADPGHASELLLCSVLPDLATHALRWRDSKEARQGASTEKSGTSAVRRATSVARRDGAVTGTSFYLGMPAAMASIFCHQVLLVLEIATLHGLDPFDPARAAEILVLRGRYPDLASASAALATLGMTAAERGVPQESLRDTVRSAVKGLPDLVRAKVVAARKKGLLGLLVTALKVATYIVPFIGMPLWAVTYARQTRRIGKRATALYSGAVAGGAGGGVAGGGVAAGAGGAVAGGGNGWAAAGDESRPRVAPAPAAVVARWSVLPTIPQSLLVTMAVGAGLVTIAVVLFLRGIAKHRVARASVALAGLFVTLCYARLAWMLRPERVKGRTPTAG